MSAAKRQPAAKAGDAHLIALERSYLAITADYARVTAELQRLRLKTFGRDRHDLSGGYVYGRSAWGAEAEAERLASVGLDGSAFAKVARELRRKGKELDRQHREAERKAGITAAEARERGLCMRLSQLHWKIIAAKPRTTDGAAIVLRHVLDRGLGIGTGASGEEIPALRRVLGIVERLAGPDVRALPHDRVARTEDECK